MRRWSRGALAATLTFSFAMHAMAATPTTLEQYMALSGPEPSSHLIYGSAPSQYVELFLPQGKGPLQGAPLQGAPLQGAPFPVVVLIHGGCWVKEFQGIVQMRNLAVALNAQGIAVWNVEYRRIDEAGGGYPGTFQDAAAALDLLVADAKLYHLDTSRVVAMGHSAGGHLVQWLAGRNRLPVTSPLYRTDPFPVREVIGLGSIGDLRHRVINLKDVCGLDMPRLTGSPSASRTDVYADTSPADLMPNGSHTVLINGEWDHVSPPQTAADYSALARQAGDRVDTVVLPNASHFDEVSAASPAWALILPVIQRALGIRPAR